MIVRFDATVTTAQYLGKVNGGSLKCWGFFPFWIGKSRASLEGNQPNPTAANLSVKDGMYVANDPTISGNRYPMIMPWNGEVWVWNDGTQPGESPSNIAIIDMDNPCG